MKFLVIQLSPDSCYFLPLWTKYCDTERNAKTVKTEMSILWSRFEPHRM